ncbi:hypothetical protein CLOSYM_02603 [[Clostridium] symbiosum ATCC 14940]|uniref:Uncharacterized protein n=1 Tax=[Clostridium] symbiosum ATCC 14940 TaxID=411472 RepID=A0ABC9TWZ4_CLOSY|nr:hypothetical protein CLOSYM_02603 [[Clostridium] symbiosum ATCC 14940]
MPALTDSEDKNTKERSLRGILPVARPAGNHGRCVLLSVIVYLLFSIF